MPKDPISPVSLKISDETRQRVKRLADARQRSSHWVMRQAIEQYVAREEKRQAFHDQAVQAWREHQESGLHATGKEVVDWLQTWGTEDEKPAPKCRR